MLELSNDQNRDFPLKKRLINKITEVCKTKLLCVCKTKRFV